MTSVVAGHSRRRLVDLPSDHLGSAAGRHRNAGSSNGQNRDGDTVLIQSFDSLAQRGILLRADAVEHIQLRREKMVMRIDAVGTDRPSRTELREPLVRRANRRGKTEDPGQESTSPVGPPLIEASSR